MKQGGGFKRRGGAKSHFILPPSYPQIALGSVGMSVEHLKFCFSQSLKRYYFFDTQGMA